MQPTFLIATPQSRDPLFEKTVVLVWHYDEDGAIGVVVNKYLEHTLPEVLDMDDPVDLDPYREAHVAWGGPVDTGTGTVVTGGPIHDDEGWQLPNGLGVTRSQDALVRLLKGRAPLILCLGYAGWGPGQLDREIELGGWLWTDCDPSLVFDTPVDERYPRALASLGITEGILLMQPISE